MVAGGNPHALEKAGRDLQGALDQEPGLRPLMQIPAGTPLAGDLAGAYNEKADAANTFAAAKDQGVRALGVGLVEIAKGIDEIDSRGRAAIEALLPNSTPGVGGGQ